MPELSMALVARGPTNAGVVVEYVGSEWADEIANAGADVDGLFLPKAPLGLSIFEGSFHAEGPDSFGEGDWDTWWRGSYRPLTDDEWKRLRETGRLWGPGPTVLKTARAMGMTAACVEWLRGDPTRGMVCPDNAATMDLVRRERLAITFNRGAGGSVVVWAPTAEASDGE